MKFTLIAYCLLLIQPIWAQQFYTLDQQAAGGEIHLITPNGEITAVIPRGHRPQLAQRHEMMSIFFTRTYRTYDFDRGPLPVYDKNSGWYLLDKKGNRIHDFDDKYVRVFPAHEGVYRAQILKTERRRDTWTVFLNQKGEQLHGGKKYTSATVFSDGLAIVKTEEEPELWQIINTKGKKVAELSGSLAKYIHTVKPFRDGMSLVTLKRPKGYERSTFIYQALYFNRKGEPAVDVSKITGRSANSFCMEFVAGMASTVRDGAAYFFDRNGLLLKKMEDVNQVVAITESHILLKGKGRYPKLLNRNFESVELPVEQGHAVMVERITDDYILAKVTDVHSNQMLHIYDAKNLSVLCKTNRQVGDVHADRLMITETKSIVQHLVAIDDFSGDTIYQQAPEHKLYTSLESAMPYKEKVQHLELNNLKDANELLNFPNLKSLGLIACQSKTLPTEIGRLTALEKIKIGSAPNLEALPSSLEELPALSVLQLYSNPKLTGLERLLPKLTSLEKVICSEMEFEAGFVKQFKANHPAIQFDNWQSGGETIDLEVRDEERVKGATAPPPPPPKPVKH